ncbi:hypothetical protein ABPG72_021364 [Tetrahymena utriculariae]
MVKKIHENQKKSHIILPRFECKCRREYDTLSSLTNHIKIEHDNLQLEYRIPRGVPGGRNKKIEKSERLYLEKVFQKNLNECQYLSDDEVRNTFKQINDLISELVQQYKVHNFQTELQRENIRLQPFWIKIKKQNIKETMKKYMLSFLVFVCKQNLHLPECQNDDVIKNLKDCLMDEDSNQNSNSLDFLYLNQDQVKIEDIKQENNNLQEDEFRAKFIKSQQNNKAFQNVIQQN